MVNFALIKLSIELLIGDLQITALMCIRIILMILMLLLDTIVLYNNGKFTAMYRTQCCYFFLYRSNLKKKITIKYSTNSELDQLAS